MSRAFSGSIASAAVMSGFPVRFNDFKAISVQITAAGTGCTISYEVSNDATTWYPALGFPVNGTDRRPVASSAAVGLWCFPKTAKWFRARCSTYSSGTPAYNAELHLQNPLASPISAGAQDWSYAAATAGILNTTTAVTIKAAAAAGLRNYLKTLDISAEALGTATEVAIRDGAGGTVLWRQKIGTGGLVNGRQLVFDPPLKGTAATLMEVVTLTASTTGAVYVNATGTIEA